LSKLNRNFALVNSSRTVITHAPRIERIL